MAAYVCPSGPPCPILVDGIAPRGDGAHYTAEGSLWVARWIMPQIGIPALDKPVTTLPKIGILVPANGATVKGTSALTALAAFNVGLSGVGFELTGNSLHNDVIGNAVHVNGLWSFIWHTATVPNGTYTLRSVAYNAAGDQSVSKGITIQVAN